MIHLTRRAKGWAYWSAAGAYVRLGREVAALDALRQAVAHGFADAVRLRSAEHLRPLHGTRGWQHMKHSG